MFWDNKTQYSLHIRDSVLDTLDLPEELLHFEKDTLSIKKHVSLHISIESNKKESHSILNIKVAKYIKAKIHITFQTSSDTHFFHETDIVLQEHAQLHLVKLCASAAFIQNELRAKLAFASNLDVSALLLTQEAQEQVFKAVISHDEDKSQSRIYIKEVLRDRSKCLVDTLSIVKRGTKECVVYQASHALLLDDTAHIVAKPHLEIYTDDLQASHGSTVGELDIDALSYLNMRGIDIPSAKEILIDAFKDEILQKIDGIHDEKL